MNNKCRTWFRFPGVRIWSQSQDNAWAIYLYLPRRGYCVLHRTPTGYKGPYRI